MLLMWRDLSSKNGNIYDLWVLLQFYPASTILFSLFFRRIFLSEAEENI
jgi:hypothetical protein